MRRSLIFCTSNVPWYKGLSTFTSKVFNTGVYWKVVRSKPYQQIWNNFNLLSLDYSISRIYLKSLLFTTLHYSPVLKTFNFTARKKKVDSPNGTQLRQLLCTLFFRVLQELFQLFFFTSIFIQLILLIQLFTWNNQVKDEEREEQIQDHEINISVLIAQLFTIIPIRYKKSDPISYYIGPWFTTEVRLLYHGTKNKALRYLYCYVFFQTE